MNYEKQSLLKAVIIPVYNAKYEIGIGAVLAGFLLAFIGAI